MASALMQFLPLLISIAGSAAAGLGGKKGEMKSTFGKGQLSQIDQILQQIKGMGGVPDITQNQGFQQGQGWLNDLYNDPQFFNKFEAPLQRQFEEQTVPELANRFASMGSGGALGSTGFRNQLAREGSNLGTNIAALRGGMQQQGVNQQLGYSQQPFQNIMTMLQQALQPTQNVWQGPSTGFMGGILPAFAGGAAQSAGQQFGQQMGRFAGQSPSTM